MRGALESSPRAIDMADVPGGDTGLLVRQLKSFGSGKDREIREEYRFDSALLQEIREYTKEAGIETGQRSEKQEVTLKDEQQKVPATDYSKVPSHIFEAALAKAREARDMVMLTIEAEPGSMEVVEGK